MEISSHRHMSQVQMMYKRAEESFQGSECASRPHSAVGHLK